jgi:eukaryotic-like serine/threonine-protein kinase
MNLPQVAANPRQVEMFLREIENGKALQHPNIVQLQDYGFWDGVFFLTMEYCQAGTVIDLMQLKGGKLSLKEALAITLQALEGLEYAHNAEIPYVKTINGSLGKGKGLVHRDIKPGNIFLSVTEDENLLVKIGDYGLSKSFDLAGLSGQTMTGEAMGTPAFMPRQQALDFKYARPEVDVWAIAASLYNMLTGAYPKDFLGKDPFAAILHGQTVPIRHRNDSIPESIAKIIDLALVDNPEIYFKSAKQFQGALLSAIASA